MRRRDFITLLGGIAVAHPITAHAEQPKKLPTIGFFSPNSEFAARPWTVAFVQRLRDLGWTEGRNVSIVYRWGEGRTDRIAEFVAEFVRLKVDVIVTHGEPNIAAAKQATSIIPIVFALAADSIGSGFAKSLARPGGNATGLSIQASDLGGKRLELLREILPNLRRVAVMANLANPANVLEMREVQVAGRKLGVEVAELDIRRAEDIAPAFEALKGRVEALYICATPLVNTNLVSINTLTLAARLPTIHGFRESVEAGP